MDAKSYPLTFLKQIRGDALATKSEMLRKIQLLSLKCD